MHGFVSIHDKQLLKKAIYKATVFLQAVAFNCFCTTTQGLQVTNVSININCFCMKRLFCIAIGGSSFSLAQK